MISILHLIHEHHGSDQFLVSSLLLDLFLYRDLVDPVPLHFHVQPLLLVLQFLLDLLLLLQLVVSDHLNFGVRHKLDKRNTIIRKF